MTRQQARCDFDVIVVGGGPCGATAAERLAGQGVRTLLVDREGRIKPCGGAVPSIAMAEFSLPPTQIKARVRGARMTAPSGKQVAMEIGDIGYVGMVDRDVFDPWLRGRARAAGAEPMAATLKSLAYRNDGAVVVTLQPKAPGAAPVQVSARLVVGADGANSAVRKAVFGPRKKPPYVFAYHEVVKSPQGAQAGAFDPARCEVVYDGAISPDFYGWVFPHGDQTSVGCGSAVKGFDLKEATRLLKHRFGLADAETVREEGAPLPLKPMRKWDDGRAVLLAGDAAGVVAPSSGEGIYYAMHTGALAAEAVLETLRTGDARHLATARKRFKKKHGRVFMALGVLQFIWYRNDKRREQFVSMCADADIQRLTWESYLNKKLVRRDPMAHLRVAIKDIGQLIGLAR